MSTPAGASRRHPHDALAREADADRRAASRHALDRQMTAMQLDEGFCQRQPETRPLRASRQVAVDLTERLHRDLDLCRRHADPVVDDGNYHRAVIGYPGLHSDGAAGRRELGGVRQQVEEDLLQAGVVDEDRPEPVANLDLDRDLALARAWG